MPHQSLGAQQRALIHPKEKERQHVETPGIGAVDRTPTVSVIVPTFNRPDMLGNTIKSIQRQKFSDFEIIVVNDDGQPVEQLISSLNTNGNIYYVRHAKNRGLAAARNSGIKMARGKYIAYLDDDDLFYPDHLETLVTFLEGNDFKVAYSDAYRAHQVQQEGQYVVTHRDLPLSCDFNYDRILYENFVPVLCFMHERSCLDVAGGFDETLHRHEDWDLWIRLSRHYKIAHLKTVTCEYSFRNDGSSMTSGSKTGFRTTCERIFQKYADYAKGNHTIVTAQARMRSILRSAEALQLSQEGDVASAIKLIEACLAFDPHNPEIHKLLGMLYFQHKKKDKAIHYYKKAATLCVADKAYQESQKVMCARFQMQRSQHIPEKERQKKIDACLNQGKQLTSLGNIRAATEMYQAVIDIDPCNLIAINALGQIAMQASMFDSALLFFQRALEINPSQQETLKNMRMCLRYLDRTDGPIN